MMTSGVADVAVTRPATGTRWLVFGIKLAVTLAIFGWLLRKFDVSDVLAHFVAVDFSLLGAAIALTIAQVLVGALRWHVVLKALGQRIPLLRTTVLFVISVFFNICLPGGVGGDVYRIWQIRRDGAPLMAAVNSVLLDRIFVVFVLLLGILAGYPWIAGRLSGLSFLPFLPLLAGLGLVVMGTIMGLDCILQRWRRFRPVDALAILGRDVRRVALLLPSNAVAVALAAASIAFYCASVYLVAQSLRVPLSLGDCLLVVPPVMLLMLLPVTIAGWGLREGGMVVVLGAMGVVPQAAFAVSILIGVVVMVVSLAGGALWLLQAGDERRWR